MLKTIDSIKWSLEDLTGGGCFCEPSAGTFVVVSPVRENNTFAVLQSTNYGETWTTRATYTYPYTTLTSEPQIVFDGTDTVYITTTVDKDDTTNSLLVFKYTVSTGVLGSPTVVVTGQKIKSAYAIGKDGSEIVVVASVSSPTAPVAFQDQFSLVEVVLNTSLTVLRTNVLETSLFRSGNTYGSVDLVIKDGVVDVYWVQHQRTYHFKPRSSYVYTRSRTTAGSWGSSVLINTYQSEFNDDKFTVYQNTAGDRFLVHLWFSMFSVPSVTHLAPEIRATLMLGYKPVAGDWSFSTLKGDIFEPTLSLGQSGVVLAHLSTTGLKLYDWTPATDTLLPRESRLNGKSFTWLRGTETLTDASSVFSFIGLARTNSTTTPTFVSAYNLAPTPAFTADTFSTKRGTRYLLNPFTSEDPDRDTLTYAWSYTPANDNVTLVPQDNGSAYLTIGKAVGPTEQAFEVTLQVKDHDLSGGVLHTASVAHTFTVPLNLPPKIYWYESPVIAERNATVALEPLVWDPEEDTLTYLWTQVSGRSVTLSGATTPKVTLSTSGAAIAGESLVLRLSVSDGINTPVTSDITINVPGRSSSLAVSDKNLMQASTWSGTIANRHATLSQTAFASSGFNSDFFQVRGWLSGLLYVSPFSILQVNDVGAKVRRVYSPTKEIIQAGWITEDGDIFLLSQSYLSFFPTGTTDTDSPAYTLYLPGITSGASFQDLWVSPDINGARVVAVAGNKGVLGLQLQEDGSIQDVSILTPTIDMLYGSPNVLWVEGSPSVVNLRTGHLLIGTRDNQTGAYYESLIDLKKRTMDKTWDFVNSINKYVTSGVFLREPQ